MTAPGDQHNGRVTLRDLARVEATQEKILAEVKQLETKVDGRFERHDLQHGTERKQRRGLILWAVTTVMTGAGVLFSIVWTLMHRGP